MDLGTLGSCYIVASENTFCGNEIITRTYWKAPFSPAALLTAYEKLLQTHSQLKSRWSDEHLQWRQLTRPQFDALLEIEQNKIFKTLSEDEILTQFEPSSNALPFRIRTSAPNEVIFVMNHAFANGLSSTYWISKWFGVYRECMGVSTPSQDGPVFGALSHISQNLGNAPQLPKAENLFKKVRGVFWAVLYLVNFSIRSRRRSTTVDLSQSKTPKLPSRYRTQSFLFSKESTSRLVQNARKSNSSIGEVVCSKLIQSLFQDQPEHDRICFSIPADLRNTLTEVSLGTPGNFTCSLFAQTFRDEDTWVSVQKIYRWLRRNTQYGIVRIFAWLVTNPHKLIADFGRQSRKPIPERVPFENFTFAFSNLGVINDPSIEIFVDRICMYTKTQTLFVGLFTFAGRLSIDVCISTDLFPEERSFLTLERAFRNFGDDLSTGFRNF